MCAVDSETSTLFTSSAVILMENKNEKAILSQQKYYRYLLTQLDSG